MAVVSLDPDRAIAIIEEPQRLRREGGRYRELVEQQRVLLAPLPL